MIERIGLIWIAVAVAVLFWPLEAAMHAFAFAKGSFLENLLPSDPDELWMRSLISITFIMFGVFGQRHINEHRTFQERIQTKRLRLQQMIDSAYDAYVAIDAQGKIIDWNRSSEKIFGWPVNEAMGRSLIDMLIPEEMRAAHRKGLQRYLESSVGPWLYKPVSTRALHRDGSSIPIELVVTPLKHGESQDFFAFIRKQ